MADVVKKSKKAKKNKKEVAVANTNNAIQAIKPSIPSIAANALADKIGGDANSPVIARNYNVMGEIPPTLITNDNISFVQSKSSPGSYWIAFQVNETKASVKYISIQALLDAGKIDIETLDITDCTVSRKEESPVVKVM